MNNLDLQRTLSGWEKFILKHEDAFIDKFAGFGNRESAYIDTISFSHSMVIVEYGIFYPNGDSGQSKSSVEIMHFLKWQNEILNG